MEPIHRCRFVQESQNENYRVYHDTEWGIPQFEDPLLFEALFLECFQPGLSFETILNKREGFRNAFDQFNIEKIANYTEEKIKELLLCKEIVRNRRKIEAIIQNAKVFLLIQKEWGSFSEYLWHFTEKRVLKEWGKSTSLLSDVISKDFKKRGMQYVGSTVVYSYLQAVGVINSHEPDCFLYKA